MSNPTVSVSGDVQVYHWKAEGISITLERFYENHREGHVTAEATVRLAPDSSPDSKNLHIHQARINLTSTAAKNGLAKRLNESRNGIQWRDVIEQLTVLGLRQFRTGEPVISIGTRDIQRDRRWLLWPFLRAGTPTVLYGAGGLGKSYLAVFFGLLVQTGFEMLMFRPEVGNVLYLDYEDDAEELEERLKALKAGIGPVMDKAEIRYRYSHHRITHDLTELQRIVATNDIQLVIVDSLTGATGGMVNEADENTKLFNALRSLHVTSLLIDHVSKGDQTGAPTGSVVKYNRARSVWQIKKAQEAGADSMRLGLYHTKINSSKLMQPIGLQLDFVGDDPVEQVAISGVSVKDVPELEEGLSLPVRISNVLSKGAMSAEEIAAELGADTNSVSVALSRSQRFLRAGGKTWGLRASDSHLS